MTEQSTAAPFVPAAPLAPPRPMRVRPAEPGRDELSRHIRAEEQRLSRLRLYSYCLTLTACVFALMSFMYLAQGLADGDASFTGLGIGFVALTLASLWGAIRVTRIGDAAAPQA